MENTKVELSEKNNVKLIEKVKNSFKNFLKKNLKMKLLVGYLTINLMYILIGSYIFTKENIINWFHYKEFSYGLKYLFIVNCIVFLIILIIKWRKKDLKSIGKPIYLGILLCIIFGIISTIFAYDTNIALEGCWGRYEGLFSISYYLTLMLLSTFITGKYKKFLVNTILVCGLVQVLYAICQCFNLFNVKQVFHKKDLWILGLTKNPNFFGTYMLLCLSYSLGLVIDSKKIKSIVIYCILVALFMFGLLISDTASCVIGLGVVLGYIFIYCLKNKLYEKFLVVFVIILSITCLTVKLGKTKLVKDMIKIGEETTQIAKGNFDDSFGTKRMFIWKNTLEIVPKHIWHGVGIDSFHKAFNGSFLVRFVGNKGSIYDKAHNEYLQTLVTQGIFALVSYLFIYGYIVIRGIKNSFREKQIYLVLPIIGYLVQAFFNISVIEVAPIFYIALGLCYEEKMKL